MTKINLYLLLALALSLCLGMEWSYAQTTEHNSSVVGTVINARTREPLAYAQVGIKGTTKGTTTDANGSFQIKGLPAGVYLLEARMIGFAMESERINLEIGQARHIDLYLTEQSIDLDGVVVSANRQQTLRKLAPSLVTVLSGDMFVQTHSHNLSQGLRFQPGLRIEDNCQNCGFNQVRINGLEGAYSQVLIDSRPVFSALAAVYGLEQIPASMVERVEVVRGGGSALFGSNAVAGVINVITREPLRNSASLSHSYTDYGHEGGGLSSLQSTTNFNGSLVTEDRNAAVMLFGQHSQRPGHDYNRDGFTELPELRNRSLGFRAYYKTGLYGKLTADYRSMHEYRRGGDRLEEAPFQAQIAEYLQHYIDGGGLRFDQGTASGRHNVSLYASAQSVLRKSYYGGGDSADALLEEAGKGKKEQESVLASLTSYGTSKGFDAQVGGTYIHHLPFGLDITAGLEGTFSRLSDKSGFRPQDIQQNTTTWSQFDQLEYKAEKWSVLLGGRMDYVRLAQGGKSSVKPLFIFSPRANLRFNPNKDLSLRLSYSEGFRAPQFFDEELHVELAGGSPIARVLSENLKEERSRSLSASVDWYGSIYDEWQYNLMMEGFATFLTDQFIDSPIQKELNGIKQRIIINSSEGVAKVFGVNLEGKIAYGRLWELQAGITVQRSLYGSAKTLIDADNDTGQAEVSTLEYERTPNVYGYFASTLRPFKRFSFNLSGTYTGSMLVPHEAYEGMPQGAKVESNGHFTHVEGGAVWRGVAPGHAYLLTSKPFFDLDAKASYEVVLSPTVSLDLSLGVQNIFDAYQQDADKGPGRASTFVYGPILPRRIYASVAFRI